jgi:hypothetical protein
MPTKVLDFINSIHDCLDLQMIVEFGKVAQQPGVKVELLEVPGTEYGYAAVVFIGDAKEAAAMVAAELAS